MGKTIDIDGGPTGWPPGEGDGDGGDGGDGGGGRKKLRFRKGGNQPPPLVTVAAVVAGLLVIVAGLSAATGRLGVATIQADEVGVVVNYITGERDVVTTPGFRLYVPFVQEVYTLDKTTQDFLMQGTEYRGANHVPFLTVRASDGSNFRIDDLRIQYEIIPGDASTILKDSGPGDSYKLEWIKAHARSILRDEFGRYSAVEVANPTVYKQAPVEAKDRLNALLEPHGIRVILIKTPNPQFDDEYENAIESRKEADQEVERLIAKVEQLEQEREQRLAAVKKEKDVEMQELQGEMIRARRYAEAEAIRVQKGADAFATKRVSEGEAEKAELLANADGLVAKYTKEAEGIQSRAQALEQRGEVVVREALIQKLMDVTFTLVPYSRDPAPQRLEHSGSPSGRLVDPDVTDRGGN